MFKNSKKLLLALLTMAVLVVLAACSNDEAETSSEGDSSDKNVINIGV